MTWRLKHRTAKWEWTSSASQRLRQARSRENAYLNKELPQIHKVVEPFKEVTSTRFEKSCKKEADSWIQVDLRRLPRRGVVEYLHRNPASRKRRRKGKSWIWDRKIWLRVPRESDPKMTALARTRSNCKRQTRNCLTVIKIWPWAPDGCRQTVGRNTRLRLRKSDSYERGLHSY
jgi:hypothetical protein